MDNIVRLEEIIEDLNKKENDIDKKFEKEFKKITIQKEKELESILKQKDVLKKTIKQINEAIMVSKENIAVFIDSDNVSHSYIKDILNDISKTYNIKIKKAYGNWGNSNLENWESILDELNIDKVSQEQVGFNKNATDMRLTLDIYKTYENNKYLENFCIISSDSDYTPVVKELQEVLNKKVIVYGKKMIAQSLKDECFKYINYENIVKNNELETINKEIKTYLKTTEEEEIINDLIRKKKKILNKTYNNLEEKLIDIFNTFKIDDKLGITYFGQFIKPNSLGYTNMTSLLEKFPNLFIIDKTNISHYFVRFNDNYNNKTKKKYNEKDFLKIIEEIKNTNYSNISYLIDDVFKYFNIDGFLDISRLGGFIKPKEHGFTKMIDLLEDLKKYNLIYKTNTNQYYLKLKN